MNVPVVMSTPRQAHLSQPMMRGGCQYVVVVDHNYL